MSQSPRARPSVSSAPWATLNTASPSGTSPASAARAALVCTASPGTTASASRPVGGSKRVACPSAQITKPPCSDGRDVVRVTLELARQRQQVGVQLEQVVGRHQARDDRRRARAEPAR